MKHALVLLLCLCLQKFSYSQTLNPTTSEEYCPGVEYSFTFKVLGNYSNVFVYPKSWLNASGSGSPVYDGTFTTYRFRVKFYDISVNQVLAIQYGNGTTTNKVVEFPFSKIKSMAADRRPPYIPYIDATLCSTTPKTFSFTKVKWSNNTSLPNTEFGEINTYQYAAPIGWKINGSTVISTTDYKLADNKPTIEPNLLTGGQILVRPYNDCATGLRPGSWRDITISRPALKPVINGSNSVTINCGDASTRTINITNAAGLTCATYEWNLIDRNWSDTSGNPITTIITTTEPKLNIKPTFNGTEPKNIVVKIKAGTEELVDSVMVTNTNIAPRLVINGNLTVCSNQTYTLYNADPFPLIGTITWTATPAGFVTLTPSGNSVLVTEVSDGIVNLQATISNCGITTSITKQITVGIPTPIITYRRSPDPNLPTTCDFQVNSIPGATYNWYVKEMFTPLIISGPDSTFEWYYPCRVTRTVYCQVVNACGFKNTLSIALTGNGCTRGGRFFVILPNPSSNTIKIELADIQANQLIKEIRILDKMGTIKKHIKNNMNMKSTTLDITDLSIGVYIVQVFDGKEWTSQTFSKE